ncbi:hypothetical protein Nepgr_030825 [Nepenthes gracilis]|uniref:Uncharacterized protein n=1 Tax=Nepenthes gracilis TaxID=150966 RepID=A0AAD3THQ4_NEPGR|nr:hypothetical protein Nepgr_030825 [Nepenthes gracilis]
MPEQEKLKNVKNRSNGVMEDSASVACQSASAIMTAYSEPLPGSVKAPAYELGSHVGLVVYSPDLMLDAEALKESSSAHVIPSFSGMGRVLCSDAADSDSKPAEAEVGLKGSQVEDGGASHRPVDSSI